MDSWTIRFEINIGLGGFMFLNGLNFNEKCAFFSLAKNIAEADENIARNEDHLLRQYLEEMNLPIEQIQNLSVDDAVDLLSNTSSSVRKQVFIELFALALCDNQLANEEDALLSHYAGCWDISEQDQKNLKDCVIDLLQVYSRMNMLIAE